MTTTSTYQHRSFTARRNREATAITLVLAVPCALATASTVVPAVEDAATAVLLAVAVLAALVLGLRVGIRWLRERFEDRADTRTAARWRATHAPHLLTPADRALIAHPVRRARLSRVGVA